MKWFEVKNLLTHRLPYTSMLGTSEDAISQTKNWYHDRYASMISQRNILLLLNFIFLVVILVAIYTLDKVASSRQIEPFVVMVEEATGITTVVDPSSFTNVSAKEALHRYFLVKYLMARESYDVNQYEYNYTQVVRLLSSAAAYQQFRRIIANEQTSPINRYGANTVVTVRIRSFQFLDPGRVAQIRFQIQESGSKNQTYNKVATIEYYFTPMETNIEQRYINPLGFQVKVYRIDDEVL